MTEPDLFLGQHEIVVIFWTRYYDIWSMIISAFHVAMANAPDMDAGSSWAWSYDSWIYNHL